MRKQNKNTVYRQKPGEKQVQKKIIKIIYLCFVLCMLTACSANNKKETNTGLSTGANSDKVSEDEKKATTEDTAVVMAIDTKNKIIKLQSITTGENLILNYTGGCDIRDKYGEILSINRVELGEIVEFSYVASKKKMYSMYISKTAWKYTGVENLKINEMENVMSIAQDKYQYSSTLVILSEEEKAMIMDINSADVLTLRGIDKKVCSVVIAKGHGYVKLLNEDSFIGGWVEVGQEAVKPVTKDMMLVVSEGTYTIYISKDGVGGSKSITVNRNEETLVDVGDLKGEEIPLGSVKLNITPKEAKLTIDGKEMDHNELITLKYGSHKIRITADGYADYSGTLKVKETLKELDITLETGGETNTTVTPTPKGTITPTVSITPEATITSEATITPAVSATTTPTKAPVVSIISSGEDGADYTHSDEANSEDDVMSSDSDSPTTSNGSYKIYIAEPESAEVYLDGNYMGLAPVNFAKTSGTHTITLRKEGYKTKSYTIYVNDESGDSTYSFSEMVKSDD